jgi:amino acid transporter
MNTTRPRSMASFLIVLLNGALGLMILGLVLTVIVLAWAPAATEPVEVDAKWLGIGTSMTIPVSFTVDTRTHRVTAPSLNVTDAEIRNATGSLRFPIRGGAFFVGNAMLLAVLFVLSSWVLWQLRELFRTVRDGHPFVAANARRTRWIGFTVIAGEIARAGIVFFESSYARSNFVAEGLRFEARPNVNVLALVCGLIILVLAEVFRTGTRLDEDHSLTI